MEIKDAAIEKLKAILKEHKKGACLRVFMAEGCCGPSVAMDLVEKPGKDDLEIVKKELKLYVHKDAQLHLAKAVIDCDADGGIIVTGLPEPDGGCCH